MLTYLRADFMGKQEDMGHDCSLRWLAYLVHVVLSQNQCPNFVLIHGIKALFWGLQTDLGLFFFHYL